MATPRAANAHPHVPHSAVALPKVATHIEGLDTVLHGGLPAGRTTLIWGGPGCGKTILALEFLYRGALAGEPGILVAFEEPVAMVRQNALTLGWDLAPLEAAGALFLLDGVPDPASVCRATSTCRPSWRSSAGKFSALELGGWRSTP